MKLPNKPKVLASTSNSKTKLFTVMIDIPYVLLPELLQYKELNITYKKLENITLDEVKTNPYIPIWVDNKKDVSKAVHYLNVYKYNELWKNNLEELGDACSYEGEYVQLKECGWQTIVDNYNNLIELGVSKQNVSALLSPFAYTTCIISSTEWDVIFKALCPKYELKLPDGKIQVVNKSKRSYIIDYCTFYKTDSNSLKIEDKFWQSINKSTVQLELQYIVEMIYDLYWFETEWNNNKYHIPFEKEIRELYIKEIEILSSVIDFAGEPEDFDHISWFEDGVRSDIIYISLSLCSKLNYTIQKDITLEEHLECSRLLRRHRLSNLNLFEHIMKFVDNKFVVYYK